MYLFVYVDIVLANELESSQHLIIFTRVYNVFFFSSSFFEKPNRSFLLIEKNKKDKISFHNVQVWIKTRE